MSKTVRAGDLFCGGGGTSTGFAQACQIAARKPDLAAVNCWEEAIAVHRANHSWARHYCQRIEAIRPEDLFPDADPNGLLASPECTWHSTARGGKPINDQLRSSPWVIPRWLDAFDLDWFIIENVPGFQNWGKLDEHGRPIPELKGQIFKQYDQTLRAYGYNGEWRVLDSANYGAYTSRPRLFGLFRRGTKPIYWPRATHSKGGKVQGTQPHKAVRECLDFTLENRSIFEAPYLAYNTLVRVNAGTRKRWGLGFEAFIDYVYGTKLAETAPPQAGVCIDPADLDPFLTNLRGTAEDQLARSTTGVDEPLRVQSAEGNHTQVIQPMLLGQQGGATLRPTDGVGPALATGGAVRVFMPLLLPPQGFYHLEGQNPAHPVDEPSKVLTQRYGQTRVIEPVVMSIDRPLTNRSLPSPVSGAAGTLTGQERMMVLEPIIVPNKGEREGQAPRFTTVDKPFWVYTATGNPGTLVQGMLVAYNGNGHSHPVSEPARTQRTRDGYLFVIPVLTSDGQTAVLDIRHRMLHWREGANIMGFPATYDFLLGQKVPVTGRKRPFATVTETAIKKMVGNAVETNMARALALAQIRGRQLDVPQTNLEGVFAA